MAVIPAESSSSLVTNRLLKIAGTTIFYPLSRLFNLILSTGKYPAAWKTADVVPVPKKGGSTFRPISLLPPLSKLFEKVLSDHINSFLDRNKLLSDTQYGFRRRRSTEMQLLQMSHQWSQALLERQEVDAIFLDCTKAFDRLPHSVIVESLAKHGVNGPLRFLLSDYLQERRQRVVIDGFFSEEIAVTSGVPQGSILGPLFFTIAVNHLSSKVKSPVFQYADDIVLYRIIRKNDNCAALQQDVNGITEWCIETGLEVNPSKLQHLRISNKRTSNAKVDGGNYNLSSVIIPSVTEAECLGATFSSKLDWTAQVDKVTAKCRRRLCAIKGFFPRRFGSVKQLLFNSLVRSVMDHASSCWHSTSKTLQRQLETIQKKFLQSIRLGSLLNDGHDRDFKQYRSHLSEVDWEPVWELRCKGILLNAFKIWAGVFTGGDSILKKE
ncbi:hypothetical protein RvY_08343 [Ramazzottius varieornatus]|uniref:Reverse transcriptase domain-containing protein n=1 Tax=Ramazzottius varieornatus TaxID=947166 RepID=A0A1D1V7U6_RAMVA|nr:hypothetical protein RvY_08343 [Ramazzottius varieornatus]